MPQHFATRTGTGLFADAINRKGNQHNCPPIVNTTAAAWRNAFFEHWSLPWRDKTLNGRRSNAAPIPTWLHVPQFDALVMRSDMHPALECTHWCYSPFLYAPMWDGVAAALSQYEILGNG